MLAAQEGADRTELLRRAVPASGDLRLLDGAHFFHGLALLLRHRRQRGADAVGVELAGQQVVDGHALRDQRAHLAGNIAERVAKGERTSTDPAVVGEVQTIAAADVGVLDATAPGTVIDVKAT